MTNEELLDNIEVEGLEYYLCCKNTDWYFLRDKKLLKKLHKYVKLTKEIRDYLEHTVNKT